MPWASAKSPSMSRPAATFSAMAPLSSLTAVNRKCAGFAVSHIWWPVDPYIGSAAYEMPRLTPGPP